MSELDDAYAIVAKVSPGKNPEAACMMVAAAVAGMRDLKIHNLRIGAVYWPEYHEQQGDISMAINGGWGVYSHSPSDGTISLHDQTIDPEDGGFCGHTWVEDGRGLVVDLMHGVDGGPLTIYRDHKVIAMWHRRPKLERLVKGYWRMEMREAMRLGRQLTKQRGDADRTLLRRRKARQVETT